MWMARKSDWDILDLTALQLCPAATCHTSWMCGDMFIGRGRQFRVRRALPLCTSLVPQTEHVAAWCFIAQILINMCCMIDLCCHHYVRYMLMLDCWDEVPENRPVFTDISQSLEELQGNLLHYVDLDV